MSKRGPLRPAAPRRRPLSAPPALEWARDTLGCCARLSAVGSHSLLVENHEALLELSPCRVVLATRTGPICVTGADLSLRDVRRDALVIRGDIRRVDLPCEGGAAPDEG